MTILKYLKLLIMKIKENIIFKILNVSLDYRWSKKKLLIEQNDLRLKANCREVKIDLWQFMEDTKTKKRLRRLRPANKIRKIFSGKKFFQLLLSDIKSLVWKFFSEFWKILFLNGFYFASKDLHKNIRLPQLINFQFIKIHLNQSIKHVMFRMLHFKFIRKTKGRQ
jgi:hypothetical protein